MLVVPGKHGLFVDRVRGRSGRFGIRLPRSFILFGFRFRVSSAAAGSASASAAGTMIALKVRSWSLQASVVLNSQEVAMALLGDGRRKLVQHHGRTHVRLELRRRQALRREAGLVNVAVEFPVDLERRAGSGWSGPGVSLDTARPASMRNLRQQFLVDHPVQVLAAHDGLVELLGVERRAQLCLHAAPVVLETLVELTGRDLLVVHHGHRVDGVGREVGTHAHEGEGNDQDGEDEDGDDAGQPVAN